MANHLIAIDGVDGSGKSVLAERLAKALAGGGEKVVLLRVDDFRRPVDWARTDKNEPDLYYDEYYDLALLDRCVRAFLDGDEAIDIPVYDAAREGLSGTQRVVFAGATIAIVEGVFVLRVPTLAASAVTIYVETSLAEARRRIQIRDVAKGRTPDEVKRRIEKRYLPGHTRYLGALDPVARAAVVIDNERPETGWPVKLDSARLPQPVLRALRSLFGHSGGAIDAHS